MAPLFHPIAAHFSHQSRRVHEPVDILLDISLADCLASLEAGVDEDDALDSLLADLDLLH